MSQKLKFFDALSAYKCPCARLDDIVIHFTHYDSEEQAKEKWENRVKRINLKNMFVVALEKDGVTKEDILKLKEINVKGLLVFTAHKYEDISYTCYLSKYNEDDFVGNILKRSYLDDSKEYEKYFDFVKWFNEADGEDYNCKPYLK